MNPVASNQQRLTWQDGLLEDYIQPIVPFIHEEPETGDAIYRRFQLELVCAL